jgi:hypothetical protein
MDVGREGSDQRQGKGGFLHSEHSWNMDWNKQGDTAMSHCALFRGSVSGL